MRQIVSLIKDNQVHYALVDDDSGELIPFADLLLPDPDRFGLHDAAVLGTNLIAALQLNGQRPKAKAVSEPEQPALSAPPPPNETARERRNRQAREYYAARRAAGMPPNKGGGRRSVASTSGVAKRKGGTEFYVTEDEVVAIANEYPEGIRLTEVADRVWRQRGGEGATPKWLYQGVNNRNSIMHKRAREKPDVFQLPYRTEERPIRNKDGSPGGNTGTYLLPLKDDSPSRTVE